MSLRGTFSPAALAGLLLLSAPGPLAACAFHTVLTEASVSQQLAGAIEVIAARPAADDPFRFERVALLKGAASASRPPHLADSATRRRLALNPDEAVLFLREADGSWSRGLVLDAATRPLVDLMLARAAVWARPEGAAERRDVFAALLAHPDAAVRALALRELDALPYAVLRTGAYPLAADDLLRGIGDIGEMPFAPVRILLLGATDGEAARAAALRRVAALLAGGADATLGASVTAAIEAAGAEGVAGVERMWLDAGARLTAAQLAEIVRALSVQSAEGDPALRGALDGAVRRLVSLRPEAAPLVAQAFGAVSDYSQVPLMRELVAARVFGSRRDLMAATAYVARAAAPGRLRPGMVGSAED
jgi:hypothetical protein